MDKRETLKEQAELHPSLSEWSNKLKSLADVGKEVKGLIKTIPFGAFLLHTDAFAESVNVEIKVGHVFPFAFVYTEELCNRAFQGTRSFHALLR